MTDKYKLYKEEKPPIPEVSVDGKQVEAVTGTYKWNGTKVKADEPVKLMLDISGTKVESLQKLNVSFPGDNQPKKITISQWNTVPGLEKRSEVGDTFTIPISYSTHPNQSFYYIISAEWEKNYSHYYVKLHIQDKRWAFKDFLAKQSGKQSVLAIVPRGGELKYGLPSDLIKKLDSYHLYIGLEELKKSYPEITATTTPVYYLFSSTSLLQTFDDPALLIKNLEDHNQ
ncbi:hypothetical protein V7201_12260 [Bacillus sp. JJ1122]